VLKRTVRLLISGYFAHTVSHGGAALAYYLLFALFPLLIFFGSLLGALQLDISSVLGALTGILPEDVLELLRAYLAYATETGGSLLWFSLIFSIYFPVRAARCLMDAVRRAYGLGKPARPIIFLFRRLIYTVVLFVGIAMTLLLSVAGRRVLGAVLGLFPWAAGHISGLLLTLWQYLRFVLIAAIMFAALGALYALSQDRRQPVSAIMPGALGALAAWLVVSIGFSFYVENFASYSLNYGALGAVVVLLTWLYLTSIILIMGAEWNASLRAARRRGGELPEGRD